MNGQSISWTICIICFFEIDAILGYASMHYQKLCIYITSRPCIARQHWFIPELFFIPEQHWYVYMWVQYYTYIQRIKFNSKLWT